MIDLPIYEELKNELLAGKNTEDYVVAIAGAIGKLETDMVPLTAAVAAMKQALSVPAKPKVKGKKK